MGTKITQPAWILDHFGRFIPMYQLEGRANAQNTRRIVIPVVVGSSPISHPSIHAARSPSACESIQCEIPTVGILSALQRSP